MKSELKIKRVIQRCGCDAILPFALVYMFYIIFHGHLSPGGGFQGGVLMCAAVLLIYLGHGYEKTCRALSFDLLHEGEGFMSAAYVVLAMLGVFAGAQFCENILYTRGAAGDFYSSGTIFWMNVTVGLKVVTGIGSITLLMLGLLSSKDIDYSKGGDEK